MRNAFAFTLLTLTLAATAYAEVKVVDPALREAISSALVDAGKLVDDEKCAVTFGKDKRVTAAHLAELNWFDATEYPGDPCGGARGLYAFTQVGARAVAVCPGVFLAADSPRRAVVLLHEAFHTVGLRERDDADSRRITEKILRTCRKP
jgi:hypothetical protein